MFTSFPQSSSQPPLPPPGPPFPRDHPPPIGPQDPFPFDIPDPQPPPLRNHVRYRLAVGRPDPYRQGTMAMQDRPDPDKEKPQTPAEKQEDEGRDEALDESFPASDPPSQGRSTGPNT